MSDNVKRKHPVTLPVFLLMALFLAGSSSAGDWPNWRGPGHNGSSAETNLPTEWSPTQNVAWATAMPGPSSATPAIWGNRVFVASCGEDVSDLHALCLDRDTGEILWNKQLVQGAKPTARNTMASPSPVTDGKTVYFTFGRGELFAFDFEGNEVWSKNLQNDYGPIGQQFGYASSPLLYKNRLYFPFLHGQWETGGSWSSYSDKDSYLVCLDAATGDEVWRTHRPSDAVGESFDSYGSAVPYESGGGAAIVVAGGDYITGNDPDTGKELWRYCINPQHRDMWRLIPSPVVLGDLIWGVQPRGGHAIAFRPGQQTQMAYTDAVWTYEERTTDVPTPLHYQGRLYIVNGVRRSMMCLDPATGKELWTGDLGGGARYWSSPTAGDGKIYCMNERGETVVLAAGDEFKILARSALGGPITKSTIAIAHNRLFIRTAEQLYCIRSGSSSD